MLFCFVFLHLPGERAYKQVKELRGHEHFVSCVASIPHSDGSFSVAAGGQDKTVRVWAQPLAHAGPLIPAASRTLLGHESTVCAISAGPHGELYSGSWDKTARVHRDGAAEDVVLRGHEQSVWAVCPLPDGRVATASADRTIRLWSGDKCVQVVRGHEDCVRGLATHALGLVSCANDNSVRVWGLDGEPLLVLVGHTQFVYAVATFAAGAGGAEDEIVSCSEDRTVRVWRNGECTATLVHPATVWTVCTLDNGDIVSGCADGVVRVWTRAPARAAPPAELAAFDANLAASIQADLEAKREKLKKLPDVSELSKPGRKEGEHKMVRRGDKAEAHTWSQGAWHYVGEVVDPPDVPAGPGLGKKTLHGKEYDFVFDVDLGDGTM